jgi:vacuolar-type H+-ATPase subunit I/STV1
MSPTKEPTAIDKSMSIPEDEIMTSPEKMENAAVGIGNVSSTMKNKDNTNEAFVSSNANDTNNRITNLKKKSTKKASSKHSSEKLDEHNDTEVINQFAKEIESEDEKVQDLKEETKSLGSYQQPGKFYNQNIYF